MLTISSIGVGPRPAQAPVVTTQPVSPAKPSNAVTPGNTGAAVGAIPSGDGGVQPAFVPTNFPPVDPTQDARRADFQISQLPDPAIAAQVAGRQRFKGELPPEARTPAQEKLDKQVEELIPNVWKASAAAVDVLIGESDSAPEPAPLPQPTEAAAPATEGAVYDLQARDKPPVVPPGSLIDIRA